LSLVYASAVVSEGTVHLFPLFVLNDIEIALARAWYVPVRARIGPYKKKKKFDCNRFQIGGGG
jgi:hypothetical protein